jgi:hypothetical protein
VPSFSIETVERWRITGARVPKKRLHGNTVLLLQVTSTRGTSTTVHRHRHQVYVSAVSGSATATVGDAPVSWALAMRSAAQLALTTFMEALDESVWIELTSPAEEPRR